MFNQTKDLSDPSQAIISLIWFLQLHLKYYREASINISPAKIWKVWYLFSLFILNEVEGAVFYNIYQNFFSRYIIREDLSDSLASLRRSILANAKIYTRGQMLGSPDYLQSTKRMQWLIDTIYVNESSNMNNHIVPSTILEDCASVGYSKSVINEILNSYLAIPGIQENIPIPVHFAEDDPYNREFMEFMNKLAAR